MTVTVKHLDPTQVELEIPISEAELEAARGRAFRDLVKRVRIPGFRPGKAPRKLFEAQYGTAAIEERAMETIVPDAYTKAIRENQLEPVEQPQVEVLPGGEGAARRLRATVAVRPPIELRGYKGIPLTSPPTSVDDAQIDQTLESLRRDAAILVPVERPVQLGDVPTIDFEGKIDGVPFDGGSASQQPTEITAERFIPGFADGVVGMRAGDTREIEAVFPADFSNAALAGKTATFSVTVHDVKVPELPALDDEFAKRFGPEATATSMRADVRRRLEGIANDRARKALSRPLIELLLADYDFPLPAVLVARETESLEAEARGYAARLEMPWDDFLSKSGKTEEALRSEYATEAARRVKATLLLEAIAKAEGITATNADIESEVASLSRQYGQPPAAIVEMLRPNFSSIVDGIVRSKTIEFLLDRATITEATTEAKELLTSN